MNPDPSEAARQQTERRQSAGLNVVDTDNMRLCRTPHASKRVDHRNTYISERHSNGGRRSRGSDNNSVHRVLIEWPHRVCGIGFIGQIDQERAQPIVLQGARESVKYLRKSR